MTKKISICGMLASLAIAISTLERFVPVSSVINVPGIKLGLSNCIILLVLIKFGFLYSFSVMSIKCLITSMLFTGFTSFVYSFFGGLLSITVMFILLKCSKVSIYGTSVGGAAFHSVGQIIAASVMLGNIYVFKYLGVLLIVSVFTGLITGLIDDLVLKKFKGYM